MQVMRPHCWGASPRQLCAGGTSKQGVAWRNLRPERTPRRRPCGADAVGQQALAHPWLVPFGPILIVFLSLVKVYPQTTLFTKEQIKSQTFAMSIKNLVAFNSCYGIGLILTLIWQLIH